MKRFSVTITPDAKAQFAEQLDYIAQHSFDNALAWDRRLQAAVHRLGDFHGYAIDEDASDRLGFEVRKLTFERTYTIHFRVDESAGKVEVVNFRHGARLPRADEP